MGFPQILRLFTLSGHAKGLQRTMKIKGLAWVTQGIRFILELLPLSKNLAAFKVVVVGKGTPLEDLLLILSQGSVIGR